MKLDPEALRYLTRDDLRVLTAVEIGMKNHELVPVPLIVQIAGLRLGGANKILSTLLRHKLLHHDRQSFDGYRLTYLGYDFLAMRTFFVRGALAGVGRQIGVGKESDIFVVQNEEGEELCMKMHRLGRTSFRAIKNKRDYHGKRGSPSWLYLSRLAATKEATFMKILREHDFPVPELVEANRHSILMSLVEGFNLQAVKKMEPEYLEPIYLGMMNLIERFARHGLIHGDFNEFKVMINPHGKITVIDFPQMVSVRHPNARMYFERDVNCVRRFFRKRYNYFHEKRPDFEECLSNKEKDLDVLVSASGFSYKMSKELDRFITQESAVAAAAAAANSDDDDEEATSEESEIDEPYAPVPPPSAESVDEKEVAAVDESAADSTINGKVESEAEQTKLLSVKIGSIALGDDKVEQESSAQVGGQVSQSADENEQTQEAQSEGESDDNDGAELGPSDGPNAYLEFDYASQRSTSTARRLDVDDIRRRVKRDFGKKSKQAQRKSGNKLKRNVVKSKEKRSIARDISKQGAWV